MHFKRNTLFCILSVIGLFSCEEHEIPLSIDDIEFLEIIQGDGKVLCDTVGDNQMASNLINLNNLTWDLANREELTFTFVNLNPFGNDTLIIEPQFLLPNISTIYKSKVYMRVNAAQGEKMILFPGKDAYVETETNNDTVTFTFCNISKVYRILDQDLAFTFSTKATFSP